MMFWSVTIQFELHCFDFPRNCAGNQFVHDFTVRWLIDGNRIGASLLKKVYDRLESMPQLAT
jgi:hypothetical protein